MVLVMSALYAATGQRAATEAAIDSASARIQAESGVELGVHLAQNTMAWRQSAESAGVRASTIMGNGSFAVYAADSTDADIDDSLNDPLILQSFGYRNKARQIVRVTLDPDWTPLSCLSMAMCAGGSIGFNNATVRCIGSVAANGSVVAGGSTIAPNVYAVGSITGVTYNGSRYPGSTALALPVTPWAHYVAVGTQIPIASIPSRTIDRQLISPGRNPYGSTNAQGIYVINCGGNDLRIRDSRIVGTLVLLNAGGGTDLENSVFMEPAVASYPVLLVDGDLEIDTASTDLTETVAGMNLNPVSTPHKGLSDTDTTDSYPSVLAGLVYVGDDLVVNTSGAVDGALIVNDNVLVNGPLTLYYRPTVNAPPGFVSGSGFVIRNGSWARVVE